MTRGRSASHPWLLLLAAALPAHAGRPLTVEDAAVVDARARQLEAWVDRYEHATTGWLVPSCNFGLETEWQVGFARTPGSPGRRTRCRPESAP